MRFHFSTYIFERRYSFLRRFKQGYMSMSTLSERSSLTAGTLFGIDVDRGPLYFSSAFLKEEMHLQANNYDKVSESGLLNGILYYVCNTRLLKQDPIKSRIMNAILKERLEALPCDTFWSSFVLCAPENSLRTGFTLKFIQNSSGCPEEYTKKVVKVAKSLGLTCISKLVVHNEQSLLVDVISCETEDRIDHFELLAVKYSGYHPSFDYDHSVFHSFEETQNVLDLANNYAPLPEIENLKYLAKTYTTNKSISLTLREQNSYPFIVVEGLDAVGKSTLVTNLGERLGAQIFRTPPSSIDCFRELFVKQCQPVCRAFYSFGNYLVAEDIKKATAKCPVVLDRFWYSSAAYAIAKEARCGGEANIPPKGHPIYQWPGDLLKPSAVVFLVISEEERQARMLKRGCPETNEEAMLAKSQLFRERLIAAYRNMNDPACIIIDASKSKEEVCDDVITCLKQKKILP